MVEWKGTAWLEGLPELLAGHPFNDTAMELQMTASPIPRRVGTAPKHAASSAAAALLMTLPPSTEVVLLEEPASSSQVQKNIASRMVGYRKTLINRGFDPLTLHTRTEMGEDRVVRGLVYLALPVQPVANVEVPTPSPKVRKKRTRRPSKTTKSSQRRGARQRDVDEIQAADGWIELFSFPSGDKGRKREQNRKVVEHRRSAILTAAKNDGADIQTRLTDDGAYYTLSGRVR